MSEPADTEIAEAPATPPARRKAYNVVNFIEANRLKMDISYSLVDLSSAMMEQSSLYVHYGMLAAKAAKQVDDVKMLLEIAESRVDRLLRDKAAVEGSKLTEPQLERALKAHPQLISIRRALNEAKQVEAIAKAASKGFEQRRDMLIQHGASERKERDGEVRTMARPTPGDDAARVLRLASSSHASQN